MRKAEVSNCLKCATITFSVSEIRGIHKMKCPNQECGHEWNLQPYYGE